MKSVLESQSRTLWLICLGGFALVALNALRAAPQISDLFLNADGDDQMRLVEVRDWLAGQGWFDVRQYRVLPPEGISMHWSRYLDGGIAAVLTIAGWVLPNQAAEMATVILWPSLLACLMVLVLSHGTARLMGPAAAIGSLAVFLSWGKLGGEFVAPRIDHHSVQILCGTAIFYLALMQGRARVLGAMAGLLTAFSLAVGLEMLPYLATIWGLMALRHTFGEPKAGDWLLGFGAAITLAAPMFLVGQTAPSGWTTSWCDVLAPPVMALGAVGVVATTVPVLAGRWLRGPLPKLLVLLTLTALGLWLAWPLLGQCLAGPYSHVPAEVRQIIEVNVIEARSATLLLQENPGLLARVLGPPVLIGLLALVTTWVLRDRLTGVQGMALLQAFVVLGVGLVFAAVQIRAANLMAPAIPLLGGFLVHAFTRIQRDSLLRIPAVLMLLLSVPVSVEKAATWLLEPTPVLAAAASRGPTSDCHTLPAMTEIASLPRSVLFTTLNLGPAILVYTNHSITSAAYHRSPQAFWNGIGAFNTEATLRDALATSGADYLVLCSGGTLERSNPQLRAIMSGDLPAWLSDATQDRSLVQVFKIEKAELLAGTP